MDYTNQGMIARLRALAIRAYTAPTNEDIFSTQYAVRSTQIEGTKAHAHPSRAIRANTASTNEDNFQYAVRSTQAHVCNKRAVFCIYAPSGSPSLRTALVVASAYCSCQVPLYCTVLRSVVLIPAPSQHPACNQPPQPKTRPRTPPTNSEG